MVCFKRKMNHFTTFIQCGYTYVHGNSMVKSILQKYNRPGNRNCEPWTEPIRILEKL